MSWQNNNNNVVTTIFSGGGVTGSPAATIPGSGSVTPVNLVDVSSFASYDMALWANDTAQATAGHALVIRVDVVWYDDLVSGIPVFYETWYPWVVNVAPATTFPPQGVFANGPMHGRYMSVRLSNPSTSPVNVAYLNVFGSPRPQNISDWRQDWANHIHDSSVTAIANVAGDGADNSLADTGGLVTLAISTNFWMPLNLYSGPIQGYFSTSTTIAAAIIVDIGTNQPVSGSINGNAGRLGGTVLSNAGAITSFSAFLPRGACALIISTNTNSPQMAFKVVAQQGP